MRSIKVLTLLVLFLAPMSVLSANIQDKWQMNCNCFGKAYGHWEYLGHVAVAGHSDWDLTIEVAETACRNKPLLKKAVKEESKREVQLRRCQAN